MRKKIVIGTIKGGVGKSTMVVNIASVLAERGYKVLVVDGDSQANTTNYLGVDETKAGYKGLHTIFQNENIEPYEVINKTVIEDLDIIGGSILLAVSERNLYQKKGDSEILVSNYLQKNNDFFKKYDYIIFDTNPSIFGKVGQNLFAIADKIICVSKAQIGSFKGIELLDYLLEELREVVKKDLNIDAIILNQMETRTRLMREYKEYIESNNLTKEKVLKATISKSIKLDEAELAHKPINIYSPKSNATAEYRCVVNELFRKGVL